MVVSMQKLAAGEYEHDVGGVRFVRNEGLLQW